MILTEKSGNMKCVKTQNKYKIGKSRKFKTRPKRWRKQSPKIPWKHLKSIWLIKITYLTVNFSTSTSMTFFDLAFHRFIIREFWISKRNSHVCQSPLRQWESKLFMKIDSELRKMPKRILTSLRLSSNSVRSRLEMSTLNLMFSVETPRARTQLSVFSNSTEIFATPNRRHEDNNF